MVIARRVLDVVREVIETSAERDLDIRAIVSIRGMLEDYLPTTLHAYLAIDPSLVDQRAPVRAHAGAVVHRAAGRAVGFGDGPAGRRASP